VLSPADIKFLSAQVSGARNFGLKLCSLFRKSQETNWRKRVRVERTGDIRDAARPNFPPPAKFESFKPCANVRVSSCCMFTAFVAGAVFEDVRVDATRGLVVGE
jgi:hypothetical protein